MLATVLCSRKVHRPCWSHPYFEGAHGVSVGACSSGFCGSPATCHLLRKCFSGDGAFSWEQLALTQVLVFILDFWGVLGIIRCFVFHQFPSKRHFGQVSLTKSLLNLDLVLFLAFFYYFLSPTWVCSIIPNCTCKDTGSTHLCFHCRSPLPLLQFSIPAAFVARKILGYPFCFVSNAAVRADGKPGGSQSLPSPCSPKKDAEATFALSCGHNCWDYNPMTSKALFQSFHSSFMHSVHCFLFLIRIILLFGDAGHLCISF